MKSSHKIIFKDSRQMADLPNESIDLIVTSPPYQSHIFKNMCYKF